MKESATYQAILDEGETKGCLYDAKRVLLITSKERLGQAPLNVLEAIEAIYSVERLEDLAKQALRATSWEDLLDH